MLLLISEVFGGVNSTSLRFLTRLAHRFKGKDKIYTDRGGVEVSYFVYHARAILARAAAVGHAEVPIKYGNDLHRRAAHARPSGCAAAV